MQDISDLLNQFKTDRKRKKEAKEYDYVYGMPEEETDYASELRKTELEIEKLQKRHDDAAKKWSQIPQEAMDKAREMSLAYDAEHPGAGQKISYFLDYLYGDQDPVTGEVIPKSVFRTIENAYFDTSERIVREKEKAIHYRKKLEEGITDIDYRKEDDLVSDFKKYSLMAFLVGIGYVILLIHDVFTVVNFIRGGLTLQAGYFADNLFYMIFWFAAPFALWIWASAYEYWNYWNRKIAALYISVVSVLLLFMSQMGRLICSIAVPLIVKIPLTTAINETMVVKLGRYLILLPPVIICIFLFLAISRFIGLKTSQEWILGFKVMKDRDVRKNAENAYDVRAVKDLQTGARYTIYEKDRLLHSLILGASGTGKTSSVIMTMIEGDLTQLAHNMDQLKIEAQKLLKAGTIELSKNFVDREFTIDNFVPVLTTDDDENRKRRKVLEDIKKSCPEAGILVMAPNEELGDNVYDLAKARGINVKRIDPKRGAHGGKKPGSIGFNPLYISPRIEGKERYDDIVNKASVCMDVLNSLNAEAGKIDAYFQGVNSIQTVTACKLLMLTCETMHGRQATLEDVQRLLNDYNEMRPYLTCLIQLYGDHGKPRNLPNHLLEKKTATEALWKEYLDNNPVDCGLWQDVYTVINNELLGPTGTQQFERANGLRNQLNLFLNTPRVRDVLCAPDTIDLDAFLADGGVLVFNYALDLGASTSMAFGEFFLLSYSKAVLRRPRHQFNKPEFMYCDEFPTLINKNAEELFSLHRQYGCSNTICMQSLSQMSKSELTRYLRDVIVSNCAQKIIFGRLSPTEMELFEKLGGTMTEYLNQDTVSETSLSNQDPNLSYSTRSTMQDVAYMKGSDMAYRDFRECSCFFVKDGAPVRPFAGKVEFLKDSEYLGHRRVLIDWSSWWHDMPEQETTGELYAVGGTVREEHARQPENPRLRSYGNIHGTAGSENTFRFSSGAPLPEGQQNTAAENKAEAPATELKEPEPESKKPDGTDSMWGDFFDEYI